MIVELGLAEPEQGGRGEASGQARGPHALRGARRDRGTLGERELAQAVAARYDLPMVDLDSFPVDPEAAELVGRSTARRYGVAPAGFDSDGALLLAMADPTDSLARSDVAVSTRLEVRPGDRPAGADQRADRDPARAQGDPPAVDARRRPRVRVSLGLADVAGRQVDARPPLDGGLRPGRGRAPRRWTAWTASPRRTSAASHCAPPTPTRGSPGSATSSASATSSWLGCGTRSSQLEARPGRARRAPWPSSSAAAATATRPWPAWASSWRRP